LLVLKQGVLPGFVTISLYGTSCGSRKYPYSPHRRDWNFLGAGWRGVRKTPFHGEGMDIFWNYRCTLKWTLKALSEGQNQDGHPSAKIQIKLN